MAASLVARPMPSLPPPITSTHERLLRVVRAGALAFFGALLLVRLVASLDWRMEHDTPLLHYAAWLMHEHGRMPYRDVFETSMPGTFAFHYAVVSVLGTSDAAFRAIDLVLLGLVAALILRAMQPFGRATGLWAVVIFGHVYLAHGQTMSLQRDYLGMIPVLAALALMPSRAAAQVRLGVFAAVGVLFGLAFLIKPHLPIGLPVVLAFMLAHPHGLRACPRVQFVRALGACAAGFSLPLIITGGWLAWHGALAPFLAMFTQYLPLHNSMIGTHEAVSPSVRLLHIIERTISFGGLGGLFILGLFGHYHLTTQQPTAEPRVRRWKNCLLGLLIAYAIYPALAGKFWDYHYMPMMLMAALSGGLAAASAGENREPSAASARLLPGILALAIIVFTLIILPVIYVSNLQLWGDLTGPSQQHAPKAGRVDAIARYLEAHLEPGDTVQPLDWTGGSIHAMLIARAPLATRYMYDYHFYHHVSRPLNSHMRREFLDQLEAAQPRFIIEVETNKPWVSGIDSSRRFEELRAFVDAHYICAHEGDGYRIHEHRQHTPHAPTAGES